jgi:Domain of unknown function (DUF4386)
MINQTVEPVAGAPAHRAATRLARVAGALYLPVFALGPFSLLYVRAKLIVPDDAAATADRIAADGWLLRVGSVIELYLALTDVALAAAFYVLFRPAGRTLALVASSLRLTWAVVAATALLTNIAALLVLSDAAYLTAFDADQRATLALLSLDLHDYAHAAGFVAFGAHLSVLGLLIWRSNLLPRIVGILLVVAGAGYVANSLLILGWSMSAQPLLLLPAVPAELSLCLWLLVKGVKAVPARDAS